MRPSTLGILYFLLFCAMCFAQQVAQKETVPPTALEYMEKALEDGSKYFVYQFNSTKDFEVQSNEDLLDKVDELKEFLNRLKINEDGLRETTTGKLRAAVDQIGVWLGDVDEFQSKARYDAGRNTEYLKIEWENKSKRIYEQGLDELIRLAKMTAAAPVTSLSTLLMLFLVILLWCCRDE